MVCWFLPSRSLSSRRLFFLSVVICLPLFDSSSLVWGQVFQQPSLRTSRTGTTVSVPDRGGALLGGVNRSASGRISRGIGSGPLFSQRSIGRQTSAGSQSVYVQVIDHGVIDKALLSKAKSQSAKAFWGGQTGLEQTMGEQELSPYPSYHPPYQPRIKVPLTEIEKGLKYLAHLKDGQTALRRKEFKLAAAHYYRALKYAPKADKPRLKRLVQIFSR